MRVVLAPTMDENRAALRPFRAVYYALLMVGLAALGYAGYQVLDAFIFQTVEQIRFEAMTNSPPDALSPRGVAPAPVLAVRRAIPTGNVIGEIEMPRVGLKAIVMQGDSEKVLNRAVGHLPDSALPGEEGNVALAAHRDGLFRPLRSVLPGDAITLRTGERELRYEVLWTAIVPPAAVSVLQPTKGHSLTLVTCFPFYYVGAAPERFVVRARQVESDPKNGSADTP